MGVFAFEEFGILNSDIWRRKKVDALLYATHNWTANCNKELDKEKSKLFV